MTRPVTRTWYRIALARPGGGRALVAAQGEHLGAAIAAAERHAPGAHAIAAELAAPDQVPLGESVGKHAVVSLDGGGGTGGGTGGSTGGGDGGGGGDGAQAAALAALPAFHWPSGVLPQLGHTEALRGAARAYTVHPDPALLVIEAQTDAPQLVDLFLGLVERLPAGDNLEIRLLDHFEGAGRTDVWLTSRVNAKKILRFLDDHDAELIANGHVELSVYVRAHRATLRLTEHKTVVWLAEGRALEAEITRGLRELGVPRAAPEAPLVTIAAAPHFHYRPAKSRDRKGLADLLYRQRLRRVAAVPAGGAAEAADADADRARDTAG